jgi:hypothetical protein
MKHASDKSMMHKKIPDIIESPEPFFEVDSIVPDSFQKCNPLQDKLAKSGVSWQKNEPKHSEAN